MLVHSPDPDPTTETIQTDTIDVVAKPRRNRRSARSAGTRFETAVARWLAAALDDDRIERRTRNGAKDRGDISGVRTIRGARVVLECKDVARLDLPGWIREAQTEAGNDDTNIYAVVHKRRGQGDPGQQYVTTTLDVFAALLEGGPQL